MNIENAVHIVLTDGETGASVFVYGAKCLDEARNLHRHAPSAAISIWFDGVWWRWSRWSEPTRKPRAARRSAA